MPIVAASDSIARSAKTFFISGCSIRSLPNAARWEVWWIAAATASRIPPAPPITQSRRVWLTISMIVGTPRPSSPTIWAQAPRNSTSDEAFERLPSLSFRRWMWIRLRSPSGVKRGMRKQERPPSAWARTRNASHIGADMNHLWPVSSYSAPGPPPLSGTATVEFVRTSEPPCFSVMPMPHRAPALSGAGRRRSPSYEVERKRCSHSCGDLGLRADRGDRRVGHRDRAADAGVGRERHEHRGAGDVRAGLGIASTAASGCRSRSRPASARAMRGGTRPRRSGGRSGRG